MVTGDKTDSYNSTLQQKTLNPQCMLQAKEGGIPARQRKLASINTAQNSRSMRPPGGIVSAIAEAPNLKQGQHNGISDQPKMNTSIRNPKPLSTREHDAYSAKIPDKRVAYNRRVKSPPILLQTVRPSRSTSKALGLRSEMSSSDSETSQDSLSDFIVSDSASEDELRKPPPSMRKKAQQPLDKRVRNQRLIISDDEEEDSLNSNTLDDTTRINNTRTGLPLGSLPKLHPERSQNYTSETTTSQKIYIQGPTARAPQEAATLHTPPASPSKPRLQSPSKSRVQIPKSPHRRSIDAFWTQEVINEWNDSFSPQKAQKVKIFPTTGTELLQPGSPIRGSLFSPNPRNKAIVQAKRDFDTKKQCIAIEFLADLDRVVAGGQLSTLSAATGGVKIIWSKTLNSTAGRAKWQREAIRMNATTSKSATRVTTYKHHASIELAVKVIDDEDRLLNVLAHEFCHLANFMISNVKDQPHGKSFQAWAAKVTSNFPHRNIHVTTKHSYKIDYKYIWSCAECGIEYKRHSKSVDPSRHACSVCKGKLVQTKPIPRNSTNPSGNRDAKTNAYQNFVKKWYASVQQEHQDWKMKDVMSELARRYRAGKDTLGAATTIDPTADKENVSAAVRVDIVVVSSDDDEEEEDDTRDADSLNQGLNRLTLS